MTNKVKKVNEKVDKKIENKKEEKTINYNDYRNNKTNNSKSNFGGIFIIFILILLIFTIIGFIIYFIINPEDERFAVENDVLVLVNENNERIIKNIVASEYVNAEKTDSRLTRIANIFNTCKLSKDMEKEGYNLYATAKGNSLTVEAYADREKYIVDFILVDDILTTDLILKDKAEEVYNIEYDLINILVDCIAHSKNYPQGKFFNSLSEIKLNKLSLKKDGLEYRATNSKHILNVSIDLKSNLSFIK